MCIHNFQSILLIKMDCRYSKKQPKMFNNSFTFYLLLWLLAAQFSIAQLATESTYSYINFDFRVYYNNVSVERSFYT